MMRKQLFFGLVLAVSVLTGCTARQNDESLALPEPLRPKLSSTEQARSAGEVDAIREQRFSQTPSVGELATIRSGGDGDIDLQTIEFAGKKQINIQDLSIPAFINEVYGEVLGLNFSIDESVSKLADLVTFRITEAESAQAVYNAATEVLVTYGINTSRNGDLLRFEISSASVNQEPPLIVSGRTLPNVPVTHRPVFQIVRLKAVKVGEVAVWLKAAFPNNGLKVLEDHANSTVILSGKHSVIEQALEAIEFFDQPQMRGRNSLKISPVFWSATELAQELRKILVAEGYDVGLTENSTGALLLPISHTNTIIAFAADPDLLGHMQDWVLDLDSPPEDHQESGFFSYKVLNTSAVSLADVLGEFTEALSRPVDGGTQSATSASLQAKLVVDEARNTLVFHGQTDVWLKMLPLIKDMDRADRMALIEVTIAEVQLTDREQFGIEWLAFGDGINGEPATISTLGGLGLQQNGFSYVLNSAGQTRAVLSAFASNNQVNVLSTPRLMTRSGFAASINVGDEVPLITSRAQSDVQEGGDSAILQEVQYQKTGVTLNISPVILSDNKISLDISQVVSDALANETSSIDSPIIQNRELSTSVTLEDGGSVLVAGMMRQTNTRGANKVPVLGDIPGLGVLFRDSSNTIVKTELVVLVVPYIINGQTEAENISERARSRMNL